MTVSVTSTEAHEGQVTSGFWALTLGSIGVVFGDIGTSPLYAFREALALSAGDGLDPSEILGVLSLTLWSLILVVTVKYVLFLMRADNQGEGGVLALAALARRALGWRSRIALVLGAAGASLFYGDAIITPSLSVLSAVEGLRTIPGGSRIDPSRRLTGELSGARDWRREIDAPPSDRELGEARILLSRILETASQVNIGRRVDPSTFLSIAEQALAIGPGLDTWQRVSAQLQAIARVQDATPDAISEQLSEAAAPVIARTQRGGRIPPQPGTRSPARLEGAWIHEFKK